MGQQELDFDSIDIPQNIAECPEPGFYPNVPFEDYVGWRAVNSGVVKWGAISPKHMHAAFEGRIQSEDTRSRKLGRAIHSMILEPDLFHRRHVIGGKCSGVIKSGERAGATCTSAGIVFDGTSWFCGVHGRGKEDYTKGKDVISEDEWRRCEGVKAALKEHVANKVLARKGYCEQSVVWEYRGLRMKCRYDKACDGTRPTILDLKKCRVGYGTTDKCEKAILDYGYHVQAAMYVRARESLTGNRPEFLWVFVEDNDPFDIQVIPASEEVLAIGWHIAKTALDRYVKQVRENDLFGYIWIPENIKPGGLPMWEIKRAQQAGWLDDIDDGSGEGDGGRIDTSEADKSGGGFGDEEAVINHAATSERS